MRSNNRLGFNQKHSQRTIGPPGMLKAKEGLQWTLQVRKVSFPIMQPQTK